MCKGRNAPRKTNDSPIARLRMERGLTQGQLSDLIGTTQQVVSLWESGQRKPGTRSLLALSRVLECTIDELVRDE